MIKKKSSLKGIIILLLIVSITFLGYFLLKRLYLDEYNNQMVSLERIERIKLAGDVATIRDFRPVGMFKSWTGPPAIPGEIVELFDINTNTKATINLEPNYKDAELLYSVYRNGILELNRIENEKKISSNEAYCVSMVNSVDQSDLIIFAYPRRSGRYASSVLFMKNNLIVIVRTTSTEESGSEKQKMLDTIADYLENYAVKD